MNRTITSMPHLFTGSRFAAASAPFLFRSLVMVPLFVLACTVTSATHAGSIAWTAVPDKIAQTIFEDKEIAIFTYTLTNLTPNVLYLVSVPWAETKITGDHSDVPLSLKVDGLFYSFLPDGEPFFPGMPITFQLIVEAKNEPFETPIDSGTTTVEVDPHVYTAPFPLGNSADGIASAVNVTIQDVAEPSSLTLIGTGAVVGAIGYGWRRRKQTA